jgi:Thrombospondin type 1 domain
MSNVIHLGSHVTGGTRRFPNIQNADNKNEALGYTTLGKTFPSSNPQCSQYFLAYGDNPCVEADQTYKLRSALKDDFPTRSSSSSQWVPGIPRIPTIVRDTSLTTNFNGQELGYKYVPLTDSKWKDYYINQLASKSLNDANWPKYMGITGRGISGYNKCENLCTNDDRCSAFHSLNPVGKKLDPVFGTLDEDDPNTEFACVLFGNTGNMKGAAYTPATVNHPAKIKGGQCWVKRCQDDLKHVYAAGNIQLQEGGSYENVYSWNQRQGFDGRSRGAGGLDYNRWLVMNDPNKNYTDYLFKQATYSGETRRESYPTCCNYIPNSWPLEKIGATEPPINCVQSSWSPCSASCGPGTQTRSTITPASNGGTACGTSSQSCNNGPCPVNCVQSAWSPCSASCGPGTQTRTTITPAAHGGTACGVSQRSCNDGPCSVPINCVQSAWSECSADCGPGTQTRTTITPASNGGTACGASQRSCNNGDCKEEQKVYYKYKHGNSSWRYWNGMTLDKAKQFCPLYSENYDFAYGNYGTSYPTNVPTNYNNLCARDDIPIDCIQSAWGDCSKSCGGGTQTRSITTQPKNGGKSCGPDRQICNIQSCGSSSLKYRGCYGDKSDRALRVGAGRMSINDCSNKAKNAGSKFFGMQYANGSNNTGECWHGDSNTTFSQAIRHGPASNCVSGTEGKLGGAWSNAIYENASIICPKSPDINNDGAADLNDVLKVMNMWGECPGGECPEDLTCDGKIDKQDVDYLKSKWGKV